MIKVVTQSLMIYFLCFQTQYTHTFPMYKLGQTSSTGVSSSLQESKISSSSLMTTRFWRWPFLDILPLLRVRLWADACAAPAATTHCPFIISLKGTNSWMIYWEALNPAPKLACSFHSIGSGRTLELPNVAVGLIGLFVFDSLSYSQH